MSEISTLLYKYLNQNFGEQNWELGSVIRELVAEPVVDLSDRAVAAVNDVYSRLNIQELVRAPEEHKDEINDLFSVLGLSTPSTTKSHGTIRLLTSSYDSFQVPVNTTFTYNDVTVQTTDTYNATIIPSEAGDVQLKQIGVDAYAVDIPVESVLDGVTLSANTDMSWSQLNSPIYSARLISALTGGIGAYTAAEKINAIRQTLFPSTLTCSKSLLASLNANVPQSTVDCVFATQHRGTATDVYIKPTSLPERWAITAESTEVDANTRTVTISGVGVAEILSINGRMVDSTAIKRVERDLQITYADTTASATIEVLGLQTLASLQKTLDDITYGTGVLFNLLVPRILMLSCYLPVSGAIIVTTTNTIVQTVNNSIINAVNIGDSMINAALSAQGLSLRGTGTYTLTDISSGVTKTGKGTVDANGFETSDKPFIIYTAQNLIEARSDV